ncbi:MAG: arginine--tRNA ligase, partial [Planctomycetes bacterium]|nr:arginine--tRNA ligase [Planctomycetota bacterium]
MKLVLDILEDRISKAMEAVSGESGCNGLVRVAGDAKFGDYQANGVMGLAKKMKRNPREVASEVVAELEIEDIC